MTGLLAPFTRSRGSRAALAAMVPALGLAGFGIGTTCLCPDHTPGHAPAAMASAAAHEGHHGAMTPAARSTNAPFRVSADERVGRSTDVRVARSSDPGTDADSPRQPARRVEAAAPHSVSAHDAMGMRVTVGTRERPLIAEPDAARAWTEGGGGSSASASMHAPVATTDVEDAGSEIVATRAALTTAQATKKLSKACQKLLKSKKKLSRKERTKRSRCLAQRREIVAASRETNAKPETVPGVTAPAPAVAGPAPSSSSPTGTPPSATSPGGTASPSPSPGGTGTPSPTPPTSTPAPPSGPNPDDVMCSAVGVAATDSDPSLFQMSRAVACPASDGKVYFELVNRDRQVHNLGIQSAGKPSTLKPVITAVPGGERESVAVTLAPGSYDVVCMIKGHGAMNVRLTVLSKADYIAQGYAG